MDKIDYDLKAFFEYFSKYDESTKRYYMLIDGERFDVPIHLTLEEYFKINNEFFFGKGKTDLCFYYENHLPELGQSLGNYGFAMLHTVFLFKCHKCGYIYHILRTSPFRYRNKSKDNILIEPLKEEKKEDNEQ